MAKASQKKVSEPQESALFETQPENIPPDEVKTDSESPDQSPETEPEAEKSAAPAAPKMGRPKKGEEKDTKNQIIDEVGQITDWSNTKVYVYRDFPITNRRNGGNQYLNIETFQRPFDQGDIMKMHGSGTYGLRINRTDPSTGKDKTTQFGKLHILNMAYPPKIPRGEWVDDPRNNEWKWVKEAWDKEDAEKEKLNQVASPTALFNPLLDMMKEREKHYMEEIKELRAVMTKEDPKEKSVMSVLLARALEPPKPDPMLMALITRLTQPDPTQGAFMQYLMKQIETMNTKPAAATDASAELDKVIAVQEKIESRYGDRGTSRSTKMAAWQEFTAEIVKSLSPTITPIVQVIAAGIMQQQRAAAQQQPQGQQMQQPTMPPPGELHEVRPEPPRPQPGPQLVKNPPTLEAFASAVLDHVSTNKNGFELGDWYLEAFGMQEFTDIRMAGRDKLLADLRTVGKISQNLAPYIQSGALQELIGEFVTWEPSTDEEEDEEDEEEAQPENLAGPGTRATAAAAPPPDIAAGWMQTQEAAQ